MKPCACGCGKLVQFWPLRRIYFSAACGQRARKPRTKTEGWRATRASRRPAMKYIVIERLEVNARGLSHLCMYCEAAPTIAPGGDICRDPECLTRWNSDYAKGRREHERNQRTAATVSIEPQACKCGCGEMWTQNDPPRANRLYFSKKCSARVRRRKSEAKQRKAAQAKALRKTIIFGRGRAIPGRVYAAG